MVDLFKVLLKDFKEKTMENKIQKECNHKWKHLTTIKNEYYTSGDGRNGSYKGCVETAILQCEICSEIKKIKAND